MRVGTGHPSGSQFLISQGPAIDLFWSEVPGKDTMESYLVGEELLRPILRVAMPWASAWMPRGPLVQPMRKAVPVPPQLHALGG